MSVIDEEVFFYINRLCVEWRARQRRRSRHDIVLLDQFSIGVIPGSALAIAF